MMLTVELANLIFSRTKVVSDKRVDAITAVLISCKKDAQNNWAFMTRDKPTHDPNVDWDPIHLWTDLQPLSAYLTDERWRKKYSDGCRAAIGETFSPQREVFAFQQISNDGKRAHNDKKIYSSVESLLKALSFELGAVPNRAKGRRRIYQFGLATIVDAPLIDVRYGTSKEVAVEVQQIVHLARYIVDRRELVGVINFVRVDVIEAYIHALDRLARHNGEAFQQLSENAYAAIKTNSEVKKFFATSLLSPIRLEVNRYFARNKVQERMTSLSLNFDDKSEVLQLEVDVFHSIDELNEDVCLMASIKKVLLERARFTGKFRFADDMPF